MKLSKFNLEKSIFVDANIFTFHFTAHPDFGKSSTDFLQMVELGKIRAVSSDVVLNEVLYISLLNRGLQFLDTNSKWKVRERFDKDFSFVSKCYEGIQEAIDYITFLEKGGLTIVDAGHNLLVRSIEIGKRYHLWIRDAIHVATCQALGIVNIATQDKHFTKVDFLSVWQPEG
ncbi:MAG: type II toxin-antitoxin system VapC family toxin [bacterium]